MEINVPELSLILLVGPSGSGKSTFAKAYFDPYEVVSSDICRGIVSNDENSLLATKDAFEVLQFIVGKRLKNGLLTVVDATNVQKEARNKLVSLARSYHALPVAIVLDMPQRLCEDRNKTRTDRQMGSHVIRQQKQQLKKSLRGLKREGFRKIHILKSETDVTNVTGVVREKLYSNKKHFKGPFDIIGDIHGCYDETILLLKKLGYVINAVPVQGQNYGISVTHPENRKVIFLGDLVDRGPNSPGVLRLVMSMVNSEAALCVPGNHDMKLQKKLKGKNVQLNHGLAETMEQLENEPPEFLSEVREFLYSLTSHFILDEGKLAVAHAGIREDMQGRGSGAVRSFCLYGETTGEIDAFGLPVRGDWASSYKGKTKVVYGHTPVHQAQWLNNTIDIDTGCVFGGALTALRYPEETLVSIPAKSTYAEPSRPFDAEANTNLSQQQVHDNLLHIDDVIGKRIIQTRLLNNLTIKEEHSIAALEVMSRYSINPKWLIYLPPTMSPCATSALPGYLEHPIEAIGYYQKRGVTKVVCEEKHMGSRAVVVVCKNEAAVRTYFGIENDGIGKCYTRSGRNFFNHPELENEFLERVQGALTASGFWEKFNTQWVCLDTELMPWSAKAQALLQNQYASVGSAAKHALSNVSSTLNMANERGIDVASLLEKFTFKESAVVKFTEAYQNYCWKINTIEDYKLAPFHILATQGAVHTDKNHEWHMEHIREICQVGEKMMMMTPFKVIQTDDPSSVQAAVDWWMSLTEKGGEGMVVKPYDFIAHGKGGLLQPAVKCRGSEYLRIIYGPEYDYPEHMTRLKKRGLSRKRSLALREFALGLEGLERFVREEPLRRVHESVFGVLALESEKVDPRL